MIKIFHEAPKSIFEEVQNMTAGDYALVHLFKEDPEYYQLFKDAVAAGREVILDNSIFELGVSFDPEEFAKYILELKPTYYIIPDVLEDSTATRTQAHEWMKSYKDLPGKTLGVIQGKTYEDICDCYRYMENIAKVDKIAISFDYSYYEKSFPHTNKLVSWSMGRVKLIGDMVRDGIITGKTKIHLLGIGLPIEGRFYGEYDFIDSIDTSNPVVAGIKHLPYMKNIGLLTKPSQKLFELINLPKSEISIDTVRWNIFEFNNYWNGEQY